MSPAELRRIIASGMGMPVPRKNTRRLTKWINQLTPELSQEDIGIRHFDTDNRSP